MGYLDELSHDEKASIAAVPLISRLQELNEIRDLDTLLERTLQAARALVGADAGTLYLKSKGRLFFSFIQNDTLFKESDPRARYVYSSRSLPLDWSSVAGYVASTGESLLIDDVYDLPDTVSYSFNPGFDAKTNYKTQSMLIVPLLTRQRSVVGVLQLINAKDDRGAVVPFSNAHRLVTSQFAHYAADAIDRARQSRESVLRLVELASLRDPYETGRHAKRVGAYATELYDSWARRNQVSEIEIDQNREIIRTAAMLHDVGKVAVRDAVLRKPGRLSDAERREMRLHTIHGARLFRRIDSPWDEMAREVALNHHECWDGTGYPGRIDNIFDRTVRIGRPKRGPEIPLSARVVSIVDVYDALMSKRAYKDAWTEADVLGYLENQAGRQFDPELVTTFLSMQGIVRAIRTKFSF